jgi:hypothetical protein
MAAPGATCGFFLVLHGLYVRVRAISEREG